MMNRLATLTIVLLLTVTNSSRGGIILDYEGDALPEDAGWTLHGDANLVQRAVDQGIFTMHSPTDVDGAYYRTSVLMNSNENVYEWSAQSANTACGSYAQFILQGPSTYSIMMVSWDSDHAWLYLWPDSLSPVATQAEITIEPGVFHTYRIEADGPTNTIYVDGTPHLSADLQNAAGLTTQVQFGYSHIFFEVPTYSKWDYIRVTSPEPTTLAMFLLALFCPRRRGVWPR